MQLNNISSSPLHTQIELNIKNQLINGVLSPGDRLLSVREFAINLNINPNTVNRAYKNLEKEELIVILPGKGIFIKNIRTMPPSIMKEKELKKELGLLLLDMHYHAIKEETIQNWVTEFFEKVGEKK
ncbi:GntR family transcriptional regulator [Vagococcus sp. DIV0080]|uniref:GntR family transcriptional regulator n=1 Tax=Candidatus Vagococcus giribetii TaxID=2230876 RepID=A0ABS3HVC9_9ENTE|nr:GntR family transcriptional regulator [Vagococcus sp. DIV0080]MBO0476796.1 GntR family transcriptional regulator [Vagococcus sp. DIV0080]